MWVGVANTDRVYHEAVLLVQALEWGASYDRVNVSSLFSFEILSRRLQTRGWSIQTSHSYAQTR